jgi:hypothetical protein
MRPTGSGKSSPKRTWSSVLKLVLITWQVRHLRFQFFTSDEIGAPEHRAGTTAFAHAATGTNAGYLKFLIKITSLLMPPRTVSNCLPSRDQPNPKIRPDLKSVICFAGPPVNDCLHKLDTSPRVIT